MRYPPVTAVSAGLWQDPGSVSARQRVELDVVGWLAERGVPVVPPSPRVPAAPVVTEEFSITLWQHVDVEPGAELDVVANVREVPRLHKNLRDYPGELPFISQFSWITDALEFLDANPGVAAAADLDRAQREWEVLEPLVASPESLARYCGDIEIRPLHGDAPAVNMLTTTSGLLYSDFEDPVRGPIELDLSLMGPEAVAAYNTAAADLGMRTANPDVLRLVEAVGNIQVVACFAFVPDLPVLAQYLEYSLPQWRESPFTGGVV